jgi:hypothetical protein
VRLLFCEDVSEFCGGAIKGSGNERFCGRRRSECSIQSHKSQKVILQDNHLYIRAPRGEQALTDNALDAGPLEREVVTKMMGLSKPIDLWVAYFASLANSEPLDRLSEARSSGSSTGSEPWEEVGIPSSLEDFERARSTLKTPKRMKVGPLLATFVDTSPSEGVLLEDMGEVEILPADATTADKESHAQESMLMMIEEWNRVKRNFDLLNEEFQTQGSSDTKFRDALASTISSMQGAMHDSDLKIQLLASRLGESPLASDGGSLTCWDAIKQVQDAVDRIQNEIPATDLLLDELKKSGTNADVRLENLGKSFVNMSTHYRTTITNINDQLGKLSRRGNGGSTGYGVLGMQFGTAVSPDLATDVIALRQRVKELEDERRTSGRSLNQHEKEALEALMDDVRALERKFNVSGNGGGGHEHLDRAMETVRNKLKEMEGRVTNDSFRLNQFTFSTFYEVKTWCEENYVTTYGTFWDLFSVLVAMKPKYQTGKDMADERYSSARIKSTPFENDLAASMSHPRPLALFGTKGGQLASMNEGFGACPTYEQWVGSGCDSVKAILTTQLNNYCVGVNGTLDYSHPATPFITALLTEVQSQWNHMVSCIETFHNDLLYVAKFTKAKAWQLLGRTMGAVFEAMSGPRAEVARLADGQDLHSKASLIWAVLRCHRIMQQFIDVKFRGHPAIVKEMTLFMLTERVDPSEICKLLERVKEAEAKAAQALRTTLVLEKEVGSLKRNYDNLMNDVKQLKAKTK